MNTNYIHSAVAPFTYIETEIDAEIAIYTVVSRIDAAGNFIVDYMMSQFRKFGDGTGHRDGVDESDRGHLFCFLSNRYGMTLEEYCRKNGTPQ